MKKFRRLFLSILLILMLFIPTGAAAQPDYIRLHIVAASDSIHDQALKLQVRDAIRSCASELLADCSDSRIAYQLLREHQEALLHAARTAAERFGYSGQVSLEMGIFPFPDRTYGDELVPAGDYRAVRIVLGEGEGRNWWCVIYPSLCLPSDADIDKPVEFYSAIWRWLIQFKEDFFS